jgi:branched-chain amino acid transport system substrate-binding protein
MRRYDPLAQIVLIAFLVAFAVPYVSASGPSDGKPQPVRIGLLISDSTSHAAMLGAELAVKRANEKGGFNGRPFLLVVKSMEGPWGTGSKRAVDLVFDDKVWAILGSHDGRNSHLVEQVSAKTRVAFVSAWASDPTLAQAFVPWFYNCVPNAFRQAASLIEEIYDERKYTRVAALTDYDYDSKLALTNFLKKLKLEGKTPPDQFSYSDTTRNLSGLADRIIKSHTDCIVLFGHPSASIRMIKLIRQRNINLPVYGTPLLIDENVLKAKDLSDFENVILTYTGNYAGAKYTTFRKEFYEAYSRMPGIVASYAYDGMTMLINALKEAGGPDIDKIKKSLSQMTIEGVTGQIRFDNLGDRLGKCGLVVIKKGIPVAVDKK